MKFTRIVVVVAGVMFAAQATAQNGQPAAPAAAPQDQTITVNTTVNAADVAKDEAAKPEIKQEVKTEVKSEVKPTVAPTPAPVVDASAQPAAPTSTSATDAKLDAIKKVRQDVEQKNDSKIIEKLEKTRLEEEKNLAEKIDATNLKDDKKQPIEAQPVQQQQPTVKIEKVEVIQPVAAIQPLAEDKKEEKVEEKSEERQWYVGVGVGNVIYNGNVMTKSNFGVMVGTMLDEHLAVEGSLTYTSLSLTNYWNGGGTQNYLFGSMDQYDAAAALKYYVLNSLRFRPYVGASADYIYRQYKDAYYGSYNNYATGQNTNSFNVGVLGGIDVRLTERLSIGGEFKYELPIYSQDNGIVTQSYWASWAKPLEQTAFTSWLLNLKFNF